VRKLLCSIRGREYRDQERLAWARPEARAEPQREMEMKTVKDEIANEGCPGGSFGRGEKFATFLELAVRNVLRVNGDQIDFIGLRDGKPILCSVWAGSERAAKEIAKVLSKSSGMSVVEVWAMELLAD
jgi:hypothetical protein